MLPITTRHRDYMAMADVWARCRDVYAGEDAVKAQKTKYLPLLEGQQSDADKGYAAYLLRAMFYPAMERTVAGLIGTVLRKAPVIAAPDPVVQLLDDVMLTEDSFGGALVYVLGEVFAVGRLGLFCDWSEGEDRPYWTDYKAEAVVNWTEMKVGGVRRLVRLVLEEQEPDPETEGAYRPMYREFVWSPGGVTVGEWRLGTGAQGKEYVLTGTRPLLRRGQPLPAIPFVCFGPRRVTMRVDKPPLQDLVSLNLSHYRTSADLEHGRHFTALPTPWVTGWAGDTSGSALAVGSGVAWLIPSEAAKVGMLEFTGEGLESLRKALEDKEKLMATVGSRLLEESPRQAETAEAVRLRQAGEYAVLATMVEAVSQGLTIALRQFAWWMGQPDATLDKIKASLSKDFVNDRMTAQEATALMQLWQGGAISYPTLYYNLQQGEWARPEVEWEDEQTEIDEEAALAEEAAPEPPVAALPGEPPNPAAGAEPEGAPA